MLVLKRRVSEEIVIRVAGELIVVTLTEVCGSHCARIGVTASSRVRIDRREIDNDRMLPAKDPFLPDAVLGGEPRPNNEAITPDMPVKLSQAEIGRVAAGSEAELHGRTEMTRDQIDETLERR